MLLERKINEDNGHIKAIYDSSNVIASTYDAKEKNLSLIFKSGDEYLYENVDKNDYNKFELGDSQGKAFHKYLRQYNFKKLAKVDVNKIKDEINNLYQSEINHLMGEYASINEKIFTYYEEGKDYQQELKRASDMCININQKFNEFK